MPALAVIRPENVGLLTTAIVPVPVIGFGVAVMFVLWLIEVIPPPPPPPWLQPISVIDSPWMPEQKARLALLPMTMPPTLLLLTSTPWNVSPVPLSAPIPYACVVAPVRLA